MPVHAQRRLPSLITIIVAVEISLTVMLQIAAILYTRPQTTASTRNTLLLIGLVVDIALLVMSTITCIKRHRVTPSQGTFILISLIVLWVLVG